MAAAMIVAACNKGDEPSQPDPSATAEEFATVLTSSLNTVVTSINPEDHRMIFRSLGDFSDKIAQSLDRILELIGGGSTKASDATVIDINELLTNYKYKFEYSYSLNSFIPNLLKKMDKTQFVWDLEKKGGDECDLSLAAGGSTRSFTYRDTTYVLPTEVSLPLTVAGKSQMSLSVKDSFTEGVSDVLTADGELNGGYVGKINYNLNPTSGTFETWSSKAGERLTYASSSITGEKLMDIPQALLSEEDPEKVFQAVESADFTITADKVSLSGTAKLGQLLKDLDDVQTTAQSVEAINKNVTLVGKTADKVYCDIKACVDSESGQLSFSMKFGDGTEYTITEFMDKYPSITTPISALAQLGADYAKMFQEYFDVEIEF